MIMMIKILLRQGNHISFEFVLGSWNFLYEKSISFYQSTNHTTAMKDCW